MLVHKGLNKEYRFMWDSKRWNFKVHKTLNNQYLQDISTPDFSTQDFSRIGKFIFEKSGIEKCCNGVEKLMVKNSGDERVAEFSWR